MKPTPREQRFKRELADADSKITALRAEHARLIDQTGSALARASNAADAAAFADQQAEAALSSFRTVVVALCKRQGEDGALDFQTEELIVAAGEIDRLIVEVAEEEESVRYRLRPLTAESEAPEPAGDPIAPEAEESIGSAAEPSCAIVDAPEPEAATDAF